MVAGAVGGQGIYKKSFDGKAKGWTRPSYEPFETKNEKKIHSTSHYTMPQSNTATNSHLLVGQGYTKKVSDCLSGFQMSLKKQLAKLHHSNSGDFDSGIW